MTRQEQIEQAARDYGRANPNGHWNADAEYEEDYETPSQDFKAGAEWADANAQNLLHDAQGDDLPAIGREVIVLLDNGKVCYGHRPNPKGWMGISVLDGEKNYYVPKTYGKGGWNIPDVKWWLDCKLPHMEEQP
jgi:hypothetical protein